MGKGFTKFKRKLGFGALLRALLTGGSLGLCTVAGFWLAAKLTASEPAFLQYAMYGIVCAVLSGLTVFLLLIPTNKRVAKRVDAHLSLGEKVQTMVAFRKDQSDMAVLQRENTERILQATPRRRVRGVCTWLFALIPAVAVAAFVGTVLVPAKEPPQPPPAVDQSFAVTPWQEQALKDLIEKVKTSDMEQPPKEMVVKHLESLLIKLKNVKKESVMKETVIACVEDIHKTVSDHNTYDLLANAMFASPSKTVQDLGGAVNSLQALLVGEWMNTAAEALKTAPDEASVLSAGILQALKLSGVDASNELHLALTALAQDLAALTADSSEEDIDALASRNGEALNGALYFQTVNEEVEDDTIYTLLSIFGIKASEVPEHVFNDPDDPRGEDDYEPEDDPDQIHSGGLGSGAMIFGSNDTVYDPDSEAYVTYGEVLGDYYAKITEMLMDGKLSPEMEEAISDYFAILFNGSANKENN